MNQLVAGLLEISAVAHDDQTLKSALADLAEQSAFYGFKFSKLVPGDFSVISNLDPEWLRQSRKFSLEQHNPVLRRAQKLRRAFIWSGTPEPDNLTDEDRRFFASAAKYGLRSGLSIPIDICNGAMSVLSFVSQAPFLDRSHEIDPVAASSAVGQLHSRIAQSQVAPSIRDLFYLSPKESTYTRWLSRGKTVEDTADIEKVKYNTVRISLAEARQRYDLCNNTQLVALAIRRGLI